MKVSAQFGRNRGRNHERGVTMILIAVGLSFMILAMAALAIDLVALYSAHNDARLAADAAALAGAKAIANSGYTTDQGTIPWATISPIAQSIATTVATQNKIAGQAIIAGNVTVAFANYTANSGTNPQINVTVKATGVPAFFSRIWGNTALPVAATSNAEAYNPGYPSNTLPVQPQCVKPWLIPNLALQGSGPIFNPATGSPNLGSTAAGQQFTLTPACTGSGNSCSGKATVTPGAATYIPAALDAPVTVPACAPDSCSFEQSIAACSPQPVSCTSSSGLQQVSIDTTLCGGTNYAATGTECLIHASGSGLGQGQDCMGADGPFCSSVAPPVVTQMLAGANNRLISDGINVGDLISTSDSLVTIPVFDYTAGSGSISTSSPVNIIGFVQAFVTSVNNSNGAITIRLVNIAGCSTNVGGSPPVQGDSISPVPVHLIQ